MARLLACELLRENRPRERPILLGRRLRNVLDRSELGSGQASEEAQFCDAREARVLGSERFERRLEIDQGVRIDGRDGQSFVEVDPQRQASALLRPVLARVVDEDASHRPGGGRSEAPVLARWAERLGIARARIVVEGRSRNTAENARLTKQTLVRLPRRAPLILVTSARHMPRAAGCFREAGVEVIPWPVDYRRRALSWHALLPGIGDLEDSASAIHEYVGLLAYLIAGYI